MLLAIGNDWLTERLLTAAPVDSVASVFFLVSAGATVFPFHFLLAGCRGQLIGRETEAAG